MAKNDVRKNLLDIRKNLSKDEVLEKSRTVKKYLFDMKEFKQSECVLFYVSYDNEVFTHDMIKETLSMGKKVVVPVSDVEKKVLVLSDLRCWDDLAVGSYNILEPPIDKISEVSVDDIDLIVVPGVGFDILGYRIGHGWGYYDKLLKKGRNIVSVGLAFECQIVDEIPTESHDYPVDMIITESQVIVCRDMI